MKALKTITVGTRFEANGKEWLVRGMNKQGKGLYCTESRASYNRVYFKESELKKLGYKFEGANPVAKPVVKAARPVVQSFIEVPEIAVETPKSRHGFKKAKGLEMQSAFIVRQAKGAVASYDFTGTHLTDNKDGTVTCHGGFTKSGRPRRSQVYKDAQFDIRGDHIIVTCMNNTGDTVEFVHDKSTNETALVVVCQR